MVSTDLFGASATFHMKKMVALHMLLIFVFLEKCVLLDVSFFILYIIYYILVITIITYLKRVYVVDGDD